MAVKRPLTAPSPFFPILPSRSTPACCVPVLPSYCLFDLFFCSFQPKGEGDITGWMTKGAFVGLLFIYCWSLVYCIGCCCCIAMLGERDEGSIKLVKVAH